MLDSHTQSLLPRLTAIGPRSGEGSVTVKARGTVKVVHPVEESGGDTVNVPLGGKRFRPTQATLLSTTCPERP